MLMLEMLEHAFRGSRRSGHTSAVFFIDLDRFKEVNDTYGHQIGDRLLIPAGKRVSEALRPGDSVGRLSGDEFLVLCEGLGDPSDADLIADRLRRELSLPFILAGVTVDITASIGIAVSGHGSDGAEALMHDADFAMYRDTPSV
jgi:diguanylate cyclase (GGDEF)-like protein